MPVHNATITAIFDEIADLLDIQGANPFRIRAYRNAARSIGELGRMNGVLAKYRDISMDPADASLIVLAQESGVRDVARIDQRGFSVFRMERGKSLNLVF